MVLKVIILYSLSPIFKFKFWCHNEMIRIFLNNFFFPPKIKFIKIGKENILNDDEGNSQNIENDIDS